MIKTYTYFGLEPGKKFLVLGAVHGNEICGTEGITRVMQDLDRGALKILRGQVTFIPICNPRAYHENTRYIERNLNRFMVPMASPDTYEARIGNVLCPLLADADVVLDIHSYTVGGPAFISLEESSPDEQKFGLSLGADLLLYGWEAAYAAAGRLEEHPNESVGTTGYARRFGAIAALIECGQHQDPASPTIAYRAIRNALRYLQLTDEEPFVPPHVTPRLVQSRYVYFRKDMAEKYAKPWQHMEPVKQGDILAYGASGDAITAPYDSFVLLPKHDARVGSEWFYLGVEKA